MFSSDRGASRVKKATGLNPRRRLYLLCIISLTAALLEAQPPASQSDQMADKVFKNLQVLKGISVNELMETMGFFSASLSLNCTDCHISESSGDWTRYADDTGLKRTSRRMMLMVDKINKENFGGSRMLTCYSCHRGAPRPKVIPSLTEQYSAPTDDPNEVEPSPVPSKGPSSDRIIARFLDALGGPERLMTAKTFSATGTREGFDTNFEPVPIEIYAQAPNKRTTIVHTKSGDSLSVFDGRFGWLAAPDQPLPLLSITGEDLDGLRLAAALPFGMGLRDSVWQWKAGFPSTAIGDQEVDVIEGTSTAGSRIKLFFDKKSGLLLRDLRYRTTAVGIVPTQTDYSDYRDVAGIKMPYHWVVTWTDGQSKTQLNDLRLNVAIETARFGMPAPAVSKLGPQ